MHRHTSHTDTHAARRSATWVTSVIPVSWDTREKTDLSNTRCDVQELQPEPTSLGPAWESLCVWLANLTTPSLLGSPSFGTGFLGKSPKRSTQLYGRALYGCFFAPFMEGAQLHTEQKKNTCHIPSTKISKLEQSQDHTAHVITCSRPTQHTQRKGNPFSKGGPGEARSSPQSLRASKPPARRKAETS